MLAHCEILQHCTSLMWLHMSERKSGRVFGVCINYTLHHHLSRKARGTAEGYAKTATLQCCYLIQTCCSGCYTFKVY
jgi:hypothetical protein